MKTVISKTRTSAFGDHTNVCLVISTVITAWFVVGMFCCLPVFAEKKCKHYVPQAY